MTTTKLQLPETPYRPSFICLTILAILLIVSCSSDDAEAPNPCDTVTCENGGICIDGTCDCPDGFTGSRCEVEELNFYSEEVFVTNLEHPHGIDMDADGNLWLSSAGTGNDDGKIQVITPDAQVFDFMTEIPSVVSEGSESSANGIMIHENELWIALGISTGASEGGKLLKIDISSYQPGNPAIKYDISFSVADSRTLLSETNIHGLCMGPGGNVYIADAGSNSLLLYDVNSEELSIFSTFDDINEAEAVPSSIIYDENSNSFFVTAFTGFPFSNGNSVVYEIDENGAVLNTSEGFTSAIDLLKEANGRIICLEYGRFSGGFVNNSGNLVAIDGDDILLLHKDLSYPTAFVSDGTDIYITSRSSNGAIIRLSPN